MTDTSNAIPRLTGPRSLSDLIARSQQDILNADLSGLADPERLRVLRELEDLTRAVAAVSAQVMVDFERSQVQEQAREGVPPSRRGLAVADDVAQAKRTSPYWGSRDLTAARALVAEMPLTLQALRAAEISGGQARAVTESTVCLSVEDRAEVDARLAPRLAGASTRQITAAARALTYEVDPAGFVGRARKAAEDRGVSLRPAPDVMGILTARMPAPNAIACYSALKERAIALRASGDPRTEMQLMADELFARLTGRTVVDGVDVEVGLVITDAALFAGDSEAAELTGFGPVPAELARDLVRLEPHPDVASPAGVDDTGSPSSHPMRAYPRPCARTEGGAPRQTACSSTVPRRRLCHGRTR